MRAAIDSVWVVGAATWRGAVTGYRALGLVLVAALYPLILLALASGHRSDIDLVAASEQLYSVLFLPVLLLLVCLVLGAAQFRTEIEEDTLVYPMSRSVPRASLVAGKLLGFILAALAFLLPSALLGPAIGVAFNAGPAESLQGVAAAIGLTTGLAIVAYGSVFVLLGLLTRQALVIGLLYGFFWETFLPLLPGPLKELSVVYYLRALAGHLTVAGPFAAPGVGPDWPTDLAVLLGVGVAAAVFAWQYLLHAEIRPAPPTA